MFIINFLFGKKNAIKFTTEGEVYTRCAVDEWNREENVLSLLFEVIDTGTGFDADDESVMFKPFSQVDSSVSLLLSHRCIKFTKYNAEHTQTWRQWSWPRYFKTAY